MITLHTKYIYVEDIGCEYTPGKYRSNIQSDENDITIRNMNLTSGDYTFNGIVVLGEESYVTLEKCKMILGVEKTASADIACS